MKHIQSMKHIQALIDSGWVLRVTWQEHGDMPYVAQVDNPKPVWDVTSGHAHVGRTVETALLQLDDYVAAEGKTGATK